MSDEKRIRGWDMAAPGGARTVFEIIEPAPPRALLPEASALWLTPGTPARPLSMRESVLMWWRLREWERSAKAWWNIFRAEP